MPLLLYLFFLQRIFPGQLIPQAVVDALFRQQLVVGARLLDPLCAQHKDPIVILDGGQSVGDGQGRAAMGQLFEALAYEDLTLVVQRAGGLVQNEDGRVLEEDPGNGNALLLAARELDTPPPT